MKDFNAFLTTKGITKDDFAKKEAEEMASLYNEYNDVSRKQLEEAIEAKASKEDIEALSKTVSESQKEMIDFTQKAISQQGIAIKKLLDEGKQTESKVGKKAIAAEIKTKLSAIKDLMEGAKTSEIELKTLASRASIANNEWNYDLPDLGQLAHRKLSMYDLFPKIPLADGNNAGVVRYYDWDEATKVRAAAMVAEGAVFPESTAAWKKGTISLQKIGDTIPITEEFMQDEVMFAAELSLFLETNVSLVMDSQISNGDGTGNNLTGLFASVPAYVPVASGIADASIYDLIVKVSESITSTGGAKYIPDFAVMNISDINKMRLKKDSHFNYIMPPFVSRDGNMVASITIIESNIVPSNTMVIGDRRFARIYEKAGMVLEKGQPNDQFLRDEWTLKVRKRLAFLIRGVDSTGFRKVTSISASLVTLAT